MRIIKIEGYWGNTLGFNDDKDAVAFYSLLEKAYSINQDYIDGDYRNYKGKEIVPSMTSIAKLYTSEEVEEMKRLYNERVEQEKALAELDQNAD